MKVIRNTEKEKVIALHDLPNNGFLVRVTGARTVRLYIYVEKTTTVIASTDIIPCTFFVKTEESIKEFINGNDISTFYFFSNLKEAFDKYKELMA